MYVHSIGELCTPFKLYLLTDTDSKRVHFVDLEHIEQTILVRLPPMFVCNHTTDRLDLYLPPTHYVTKGFDHIEKSAIMFINKEKQREQSFILSTSISENVPVFNTDNSQSDIKNFLNTFVEPIIALNGISYDTDTDPNFSFLYETVQLRQYKIDPPTLKLNADVNLFLP